jgi:hypothetical protein
MYIFEFEHTLNQEDLTDIWQNLPPRIARAFDANDGLSTDEIMQTKEITHSIGNGELLTDVEDKLQWMVFKVKQKAQKNYYKKVISSNTTTDIPKNLQGAGLGAALSKQGVQETDFLAGGAAKGATTLDGEETVGYNWPYDFFSLVELAKIDEDVVFGTPVAVTVDKDIDISKLTKPEGGFLSTKKVSKTVVEQIADQATSGFTTEGVQNTLGTVATETTKTIASQVDPSNPNQLVRTGVVTKVDSNNSMVEALMGSTPEAQAQAEAVEALASPIPTTKKVSTSVNNNSTTTIIQEEAVTEMEPSDSVQEIKNIGQIKKSDFL